MATRERVTVRTPSTIGNFGPGFDVTSLAIDHGGDRIEVRDAEGDDDSVTVTGAGSDAIPTAWQDNCAAIAYEHLRMLNPEVDDSPVHLHIHKGVPPGSGLGSSASSSAAGALAFAARHHELGWESDTLVAAAIVGEGQITAGRGDDVAAALLGGLSLAREGHALRVEPPRDLHVAIVRPHMTLETRRMREAIGAEVPLIDAITNISHTATIIDACHRDDLATLAACLSDRIAAPARRPHLPFHDAVVEAARGTGATAAAGAAIAGSGPSMFTLATEQGAAKELADAMAEAVRDHGIEADAIVARPERRHPWKEALRA